MNWVRPLASLLRVSPDLWAIWGLLNNTVILLFSVVFSVRSNFILKVLTCSWFSARGDCALRETLALHRDTPGCQGPAGGATGISWVQEEK